jgi:segregation and condensation protein A
MEEAGDAGYWEEMTEFLILMSLLVEIKSRLLLPGSELGLETEMTPEQARDQLLARLFEYSKFKAAAERLHDRARENAACLMRPAQEERRRRLPPLDTIAGTADPMVLRGALLRVLEARKEPDTTHIAQIKVELQRQIRIIRGILARRGRLSFDRVFAGEPPLVQAISLFALLDLIGRGEIRVSQSRPFGDIDVRPREIKKAG